MRAAVEDAEGRSAGLSLQFSKKQQVCRCRPKQATESALLSVGVFQSRAA
jgi:hypothetical protein